MVLYSGSSMCYIPSICQVLNCYPSTVFEYAITHTHTGNSILFSGLSEKVWSQRSKSRFSWVWHPQFRLLNGKTSFGSVPGLLSTCSCQPSHFTFMTKDSGVCLLCQAERTPPELHGKWLSIIWEKYFRRHVEESSFAAGSSKSWMRAGVVQLQLLNQIWPCLMFKESKMFSINVSELLWALWSLTRYLPQGGGTRWLHSVTIYWTPSVCTRQCTRCWRWIRSFCQEAHSLVGGTDSYIDKLQFTDFICCWCHLVFCSLFGSATKASPQNWLHDLRTSMKFPLNTKVCLLDFFASLDSFPDLLRDKDLWSVERKY